MSLQEGDDVKRPIVVAAAEMKPRWELRLDRLWRRLREGGSLLVGVPDYERYVAHMRKTHPDLAPLTREAFVAGRMEARYGGKGAGKCPC